MDAETSSTTHAAASKTDRDGPRYRTRRGTRDSPKNPSNGRQSTTQKLPQHRHTWHRRKRTAPGRETLRPHRNSTAEQQQGHPGAKRAYRRNAPRRDTRTAADRTRSEGQRTRRSDQTEDANAQHKSTAKATANRANERRHTHRRMSPPGSDSRVHSLTIETRRRRQTRPRKVRAPETTQQEDNVQPSAPTGNV